MAVDQELGAAIQSFWAYQLGASEEEGAMGLEALLSAGASGWYDKIDDLL